MNTRSLSGSLIPRYVMPVLEPKYDVSIDFDAASSAWRANKKRRGESYVYTSKNDKVCGKRVRSTSPQSK
jgi:hypothetical protein